MGTSRCCDSSPAPTARAGLCIVTSARVQPSRESRLLWPRFFSGRGRQLAAAARSSLSDSMNHLQLGLLLDAVLEWLVSVDRLWSQRHFVELARMWVAAARAI